MKLNKRKILPAVAAAFLVFTTMSMPVLAENVSESVEPHAVRIVREVKSYAPEKTYEFDTVLPAPKGVSVVNKSISVSVGSSYSKSFKMDNLFADPHNAFNVSVSNPDGKYHIKAVRGNGEWSHDFSTKEVGSTATVDECLPGVTYTVYVINDDSVKINATVSITSYVK